MTTLSDACGASAIGALVHIVSLLLGSVGKYPIACDVSTSAIVVPQ